VLDLDETLVHTLDSPRLEPEIDPRNKEVLSRMYKLKLPSGSITGFTRPGLEQFLKFCNNYADSVVIWTAGTEEYANAIVRHIYRNVDKKPKIVLSRHHCVLDSSSSVYKKPLASLENMAREVIGSNILPRTIIIDDRPETSSGYNPGNQMVIPRFTPSPLDPKAGGDDKTLARIINYLMWPEVRHCRDVTKLSLQQAFDPHPLVSPILRTSNGLIPTHPQLRLISS